MAEIKKVRAQAKGKLTRAATSLIEVLSGEEISEERKDYLMKEFDEKLKTYDDKQGEYELTFEDEEEMLAEMNTALNFRQEKMDILVKCREARSKVQIVKKGNIEPESSRTYSNLPKLTLPSFDGDILKFQGFWDQFVAIIDTRNDLPKVNKFSYLQSVLKGDAKASLQGLSLTESNYDTAKQMLLRRFGRKEKVIVAHIQKLLAISSNASLWQIYDQVQVHVRSLANLEVTGENYGLVLTPIILHQLPANVRLEWARTSEGKEGDVEHLLTFLFDEIQRRERSTQFVEKIPPSETDRRNNRRGVTTASSLIAPANNGKRRHQCAFCSEAHFSDKCPSIQQLSHDQRKQRVKELRLCFNCLSPKHTSATCSKTCFFCKKPHHSVLHRFERPSQPKPWTSQDSRMQMGAPTAAPFVPAQQHNIYSNRGEKCTLMQVVQTDIDGVPINILFDSGSDHSYIKEQSARQLQLRRQYGGREDKTLVSTFGGDVVERQHKLFNLEKSGITLTLLSIKTIAKPMTRRAVPPEIMSKMEHISIREDMTKDNCIDIDILIGLDFYHSCIYSECINFGNGLVAQNTVFGWMISGSYPRVSQGKVGPNSVFLCKQEPSEETIRNLWELDAIGVNGGCSTDGESQQVFKKFAEGVSKNGMRYQVNLPWVSEEHKGMILDNKLLAEKRLVSLYKKLDQNPELKERYLNVFEELEKTGVIEQVPSEPEETGKPVFYLPHRPVIREESQTTKVRPVFDASARGANGVSLNDCMEVGPKLTPDLVQILLRFRRWRFGLTADIQKAFLQIELAMHDREVHRFLLLDAQNHLRIMRFNRVTFGNASSPFILNAVIKLHLEQCDSERTVEELKKNLYVDDWLTGDDHEGNLLSMIAQSKHTMSEAGFNLRKWASNSSEVRENLNRSIAEHDLNQVQKVLGLTWHTGEDCFKFETTHQVGDKLFTKRTLLGLIARQFDPIGFLTPFTVCLKILFQDVWRSGYEWDTALASEVQAEIQAWVQGLMEISLWQIPRRLTLGAWTELNTIELYVFVDASEKAYGTCVYLRGTDDYGSEVRLVASKVRVAPLKKVTLPRLELLSALLGARLLNFVRESLELPPETPYHCFTDSMIALAWIQGNVCRWKQFVRNRVEEVQQLTNPANWYHCPGKENPADLLTRGVKASTLINSNIWSHGPEYIACGNFTQYLNTQPTARDLEGVRSEELRTDVVCSVAPTYQPVVQYERFSSFPKLMRVIVLVLKFVSMIKSKSRTLRNAPEAELIGLGHARRYIFKDVQRRTYPSEIMQLRNDNMVSKKSSLLNLSPFMDEEGLLRIQGRLGEAPDLTYEEKHPIILPKSHVTYLLVKHQHALLNHGGVGTMISSLRGQYWIVGVRCLAKQVVKHCVRCRRFDSRPMDQVTAPLPHDRVTQAPPFAVTGLDHAGPLYCSNTGDRKLYILLFTCSVTRALHLELVDSLSLVDFLLGFRRFVARRALPNIIYSDNATTFKTAKSLLETHFGRDILWWKNICPLSPNWGGWWERLIRSVKSSLKKTLGRKTISRVELETILPEIEACVNSRPLTNIAGEEGTILTPSHFLIGRGTPLTSSELGNFQQFVNLSARKEFEDSLTQYFWQIWKGEYLRNLPPLTHKSKKFGNNVELDSIVIIKDDKKPRLVWALGRVIKLFEGVDRRVRAVQLKTEKGICVRSISHICPLEGSGKELHESFQMKNQPDDPTVNTIM